jgi:proline dehydrogenase
LNLAFLTLKFAYHQKGGSGYSVFKYVPYGPLEEVLPYLSRRAIENGKGVFEKVEKEKRLVLTELKRRLKN